MNDLFGREALPTDTAEAVVIMGKMPAPRPRARFTGRMPVPPIVASVRRYAARRALDGHGEASGARAAALRRESSRTGKGASRLDIQIAPLRNVAGDLHGRARGKAGHLGTSSAGAGAGTIRRLRRPRLAGREMMARIEQAQIDQGRGEAGTLHPGVVAAGTGCRWRNSTHSREHKPCHGR